MAIGRLNRKVALIGFAVIALLLLAVIGVVLRLGQDPKEFIRDAEVAIKAAREATDEQTKEESYKKAGRVGAAGPRSSPSVPPCARLHGPRRRPGLRAGPGGPGHDARCAS